MSKQALTVNVKIEGVRETLAAFNRLPKEASAELRKSSKELAELLAREAQTAGRARGGQAALVAGTVKAASDRVPVVQAGGAKRLGKSRAPAWKLLFGSEFGSNQYKQFHHAHTGRDGLWFFPSVEKNAAKIAAAWNKAADEIADRFGKH